MPWQRRVVDVGLEVDPATGEWAYSRVAVTVQRQAGKTTVVRPVVAHRCGQGPRRRAWMTAQTRLHARRRWMDATDAMLGSPLASRTRRKVSHGHEELRWASLNSTFEPFAPNADSLHGETPHLVAVDELWAFDAEQAEALQGAYLPGFLTLDAQDWLLSTAGTPASAWLNEVRSSGRSAVERGLRAGTAFFEWGLPDEVGGAPVEELGDEALLAAVIAHHPARGFTLRPASVAAAQGRMSRGEFLRAFGNRTSDDDRPRVIDRQVWGRARTNAALPAGAVALGLDVDPDRRDGAVSAAVRTADGRGLVEVVDQGEGTRWVAGRVVELLGRHEVAAVAVNEAGPARDVADELERAGVALMRVQARDWAAACARFHDEVAAVTGAVTVRHRGQHVLDAAVDGVGKRRVGGAWAWGPGPGGESITALTSATLAVWAWDHRPEPDELGPFRIW